MKNKLLRLLQLVRQFRALFPSRVPVGMAEFETWAASFSEIYDLPTKDELSIKFTLASIIMHIGADSAFKSKHYFYLVIMSSASKQVAGAVFYDIKQKQKELEAKLVVSDAAKILPN